MVGIDRTGGAADAETGAGVALRIEIDDQNGFMGRGHGGRQIDGGGGFAHAALLIGDGDDARLTRLGHVGPLLK